MRLGYNGGGGIEGHIVTSELEIGDSAISGHWLVAGHNSLYCIEIQIFPVSEAVSSINQI